MILVIPWEDFLDHKGRRSMNANEISKTVLDAAMKVHTALGAGLLEEADKVVHLKGIITCLSG